jgi:glycosyltransferase involved in cell wall biosynthesis
MNKRLKVSVAMATYNGEKYIKKQIETILLNLKEQDELIISDDGSTDNTITIINSFDDKRIKLIEGPKKGIKQNFSNAISHTTGDIIFLSDQDDEWEKDKVSTCLKYFVNSPKVVLLQHDAVVVDSKDDVLFESFAAHRNVKTGVLKNIIKNSYHGCCMVFRKELKKEILPIPDDIYLHDQWIGLVAELNGKTIFISEKLMKYKRHEDNASSFEHLPVKNMVKNRLQMIRSLIRYRLNRKKLK